MRVQTFRPLLVTMTGGGATTAVRTSLPLSTTTICSVSVGEPGLESVIVPLQSAFTV
jgi:hypothetical protein